MPVIICIMLLAALAWFGVHLVRESESGVIYTLGRLSASKGPGLVLIVPGFQSLARVSMRTQVVAVASQDVALRGRETIRAGALVCYRVADPSKALLKVEAYPEAMERASEAALHGVLGAMGLEDLAAGREKANEALARELRLKADAWGIEVESVDVSCPGLPSQAIACDAGETPPCSGEPEPCEAAPERPQPAPEGIGDGLDGLAVSPPPELSRVDASAPEVEKIVNAIILAALKTHASAVHFEPYESPDGKDQKVMVRLRVEGVLRPGPFNIPWAYRFAIMAKLKIMTSEMDITERRLPQTGLIKVLVCGVPVDLSVQIAPTAHGEACVLRVLERRTSPPELRNLGFLPDTESRLFDILRGAGRREGHGLVLVSGPSSSGKSSTLYACIGHAKGAGIKVVTGEASIEYVLADVVQMPLNPGASFGGDLAMRTALRMDADIFMLAEMMNLETAQLACETALRGCMVFAGIHTSDAPSTVIRLLDMGVPPYVVADALTAVLGQRLRRRLCPECKKPRNPTESEAASFKRHGVELAEGAKVFQNEGCEECGGSGFKGRLGLHELLVMTDPLRSMVLRGASAEELRGRAARDGMRTLVQDGLEKAKLGWTTVHEIMSLAGG